MSFRSLQGKPISFKVHKLAIGLFVSFGLIFSIFSSIDCRFVRVDIGFQPDNTIYRDKEFSLGLWSMEDPIAPGKCLMIDISHKLGSITSGDHYYSYSFFNGDVIWAITRIVAVTGMVFGLIDVVIIWALIFSTSYSQDTRKETILYFSLLPFLLEGTKFGLFFNIGPCTSKLWEQDTTVGHNMVEMIETFEADNCYIDRSTYVSLCALICYLFVLVYLAASLIWPDYTHQVSQLQRRGVNVMDFDDISMPSYLGSIGESVTSQNTMKVPSVLSSPLVDQTVAIVKGDESSISSSTDPESSMCTITIDSSNDDSSFEYEDYCESR